MRKVTSVRCIAKGSEWASVVWLALALLACTISPSRAQLELWTGGALVDSFPVVRIPIAVSENGKPAQPLTSNQFSIVEDGANISPVSLLNCSGSPNAAIVVLSDVSSSMYASTGNGNTGKYFDSYSKFLAQISAGSQLALVPFTDTVAGYLPGGGKWYQSANKVDTSAFMAAVQSFNFLGNTDLDGAIDYAVQLLATNALQQKVIVLVTDDGVINESTIDSELRANNIRFLVMELGHDTVYSNDDLARDNSGEFLLAPDSNAYAADMTELGKHFLAEACTLRYISPLVCPWEARHFVSVHLDFGADHADATLQYRLGHNTHDSIAPIIMQDSSHITSRVVKALEIYPCGSGIRSFTDSLLVNFAKLKPRRALPDSASDSLVVIDSMSPASGYYIAIDSAGNRRRVIVSYHPRPDTLAPELPFTAISSGAIVQNVFEQRPWDRGLFNIVLAPAAKNIALDSIHYFSRSFARAYLHVIDRVDTAHACIVATDSVGNKNTACYDWFGVAGDTLAPVVVQSATPEPLTKLLGTAMELRAGDGGLSSVVATPLTNCANPAVTFVSKSLATISISLTDSLYAAKCVVVAFDSAHNEAVDTFIYTPLADTRAPVATLSAPATNTRLVTATEVQPWDRGIQLVSSSALTNMTAAPATYTDARHASVLVTISDLTIGASCVVTVTDSAGNGATTLISYSPVGGPAPLQPLTVTTPYDFGRIPAATIATANIRVTNPNAVDVILTKRAFVGDDSVFASLDPLPITIAAGATQALHFEFHPALLGTWKETFSFSNDTIQLASIGLLGISTGLLKLWIDTASLANAGSTGMLNMRMEATPVPINLDSLAYTISWNSDVALLGTPVFACNNLDTGLCNYTFTFNERENAIAVVMRRKDVGRAPSLGFANAAIAVPIVRTFVSNTSSTAVNVSAMSAGPFMSVRHQDGRVLLGSVCSDSTLRAAMSGNLTIMLTGIQPNPAKNELRISFRTATSDDVEIELLDLLGRRAVHQIVSGTPGDHALLLPIPASVRSGEYILRVRTDGAIQSRRVAIVR